MVVRQSSFTRELGQIASSRLALLWLGMAPEARNRGLATLAQQCVGKIPGYTGYVPGKDAESVFGATYNRQGELAAVAATGRALERSDRQDRVFREGTPQDRARSTPPEFGMPRDIRKGDFLDKAKTLVTRKYWVPSLPGYAGYVPAKESDNVHGATFRRCNEMSAHVHEQRGAPQWEDYTRADRTRKVFQQAREFAFRPLPGYQGHIRGKEGESIFGARFAQANQLAFEAQTYRNPMGGTWGHP